MHCIRKEHQSHKGYQTGTSVEQTSALEGYHSVVNQFAPKMFAFSYLGILSRYNNNCNYCINIFILLHCHGVNDSFDA